jgi:hypothetical protein
LRQRWSCSVLRALIGAVLLLPTAALAAPEQDQLAARATAAMTRAAAFFRDEVAVQGSYGWRYSADLTYRRGEDLMTPSQGWVQPPGTPAIGLALLQAHAATGDRAFLEGAAEAARALHDPTRVGRLARHDRVRPRGAQGLVLSGHP